MTLLEYLLLLTGVLCSTAAGQRACSPPPHFEDKALQGDWNADSYPGGTQAKYDCRPGFSRLGTIRFICSEGQWEQSGRGECKKRNCGHPGDIDFGTFDLVREDQFVFGAKVEYKCDEGYRMISKVTTKECTATGWNPKASPSCEAKICPPVEVGSGVNLLSTSLDEEYSIGQVIRFECKNVNQKLRGPSEMFCTSEGQWNANPPTCEDIKCPKPEIPNGNVNSQKPIFNKDETIEFTCRDGYRSTRTAIATCRENGWTPTPVCEEIVCRRESVKNGEILEIKELYKFGDTVTLKCDEGYVDQKKPEEPRKCTANGWSPPLRCISKRCERPEIPNGKIYWDYSFPKTKGQYFDFNCNSDYIPPSGKTYERVYCTSDGWDHKPECKRKCRVPFEDQINAHYHNVRNSIFIEGVTLTFQCYGGYKTANGGRIGQVQCLPNGNVIGDKCSKTCHKPKLDNGNYTTSKDVFDIGKYVTYECNEGFFSGDSRFDGRSRCADNGWSPEPNCRELSCLIQTYNGQKNKFKYGEVVQLKCVEGLKLEGSESIQCYYYGWGPQEPYCVAPGIYGYYPVIDTKDISEPTCPPPSAPPFGKVITDRQTNKYVDGDEAEIQCSQDYVLFGSKKVRCENGKWTSPTYCIKKESCRAPPQLKNGEIMNAASGQRYSTGSVVKYRCNPGYHISGDAENTCMGGEWLPAPDCIEDSCKKPDAKEHRTLKNGQEEYKHGEKASFECSEGFSLSGDGTATCITGRWDNEPTCVYTSCGSPPEVKNGKSREQKTNYLTGEKAYYDCNPGFSMAQSSSGYVTCRDGLWTDPPACKKTGQPCGPPPVVNHGDIADMKKLSYPSGSSVKYQCINFYKLEGNERILCKDGEWEKEPVCRVPCTVNENAMKQNNIKLKYLPDDKKIYSEHGDSMSLLCLDGYEIADESLLRVKCLDGVINLPKCLKKGSCVLQNSEMSSRNILYNQSPDIENGKNILFQCVEGTIAKGTLEAKCVNGQIQYPGCVPIAPCILSQEEMTKQNIYYNQGKEIQNGETIVFECAKGNTKAESLEATCKDGQIKYPKCVPAKSCDISDITMEEKHIELVQPNDNKILKHDEEVMTKCKASFRYQGGIRTISCFDGKISYPKCFPKDKGTCRIDQDELDKNFLQLHEKHDGEVFYEEGETVEFKCSSGQKNKGELIARCVKSKEADDQFTLTYPKCEDA